MKKLFCLFVTLLVLSCDKPLSDTVAPEYADWYVLKSPVDRDIDGVWGDIDKTLLISTTFSIYRSTNRGQSWQLVYQVGRGGMTSSAVGVVQHRDTLFTMSGYAGRGSNYFLSNATNYSVDDGQSWQPYRNYNATLDPDLTSTGYPTFLAINPVVGSNGTSYKINRVFLSGPNATTGVFETPGVITDAGRRIDLPQLHQLNSLYFDSRERLYISGTDAVCSKGQDFAFCNSKNGRGVVYVSKKPLP